MFKRIKITHITDPNAALIDLLTRLMETLDEENTEQDKKDDKPQHPQAKPTLVTAYTNVKTVCAFDTTFTVPDTMKYAAVDDDGEVYAYTAEVEYNADLEAYDLITVPTKTSHNTIFLGRITPCDGVKHIKNRVVKI